MVIYVAVASVLGSQGEALGSRLLGDTWASPVASASAVTFLAAIASGTMALTGIVFSLVFVAFQIGGSAYSPRVVDILNARNRFLGHALGIFTGTFMYALLAIRAVDIAGSSGVNIGVIVTSLAWLLASVVVLALLLPQVKTLSIAVVLPVLHRYATVATARVYRPARDGVVHATQAAPADMPVTGEHRHAGEPCYLTGIDVPRLVRLAVAADAIVVLPPAIGDAVIAGDRLAIVLGGARAIPEARLRETLWLEPQRSPDNDPAYALRLLVDIAIRALSPAINDPTTAVSVLDEIDGLLRLLGARDLEDNVVVDEDGLVRIVRTVPSWDDLVALALTEIHQYGRDSFQVQRRLGAILQDLAERLPPDRRLAIERFGRWRTESRSDVLHAATGWTDPRAVDRQGLGHSAV